VKSARRPATYEDLLAAPEHLVAEIIDGELVTSPRPASRHAVASSAIGAAVGGAFGIPPGRAGQPGGWWILNEPELHFGADILVPDLAGWRRERMPRMLDVPYFELAPDWVCEVASPSTVAIDRSRKMRIHAREGIARLWLVDPLAQTLEVYRRHVTMGTGPSATGWLLIDTHAGPSAVRAEPFDRIEADLARWWIDTA
jgi:Uma2 family endonuclease